MRTIKPLAISRHAPTDLGSWQVVGVHTRAINLLNQAGRLLTLHRHGQGISSMGWLLRQRDFDTIRARIAPADKGQLTRTGLQLAGSLLTTDCRHLILSCHATQFRPLNSTPFNALIHNCQQSTGLCGPLAQLGAAPLADDLALFSQQFTLLLHGKAVNWAMLLGKGPGLTPSHDDTLLGMLLVAWAAQRLPVPAEIFATTGDLMQLTTSVSAHYLLYAAQGYFSSPLLQLARALTQTQYLPQAFNRLLALGHTSGADTLLGVWLALRVLKNTPL